MPEDDGAGSPPKPPAFEFRKRGRSWVVVGPHGSAGSPVTVGRRDGTTIKAVLTGMIGRDGDRWAYHWRHPDQTLATEGEKASIRRILDALGQPGRLENLKDPQEILDGSRATPGPAPGGIQIGKYYRAIANPITREEARRMLRTLSNTLDATKPATRDEDLMKLRHMIHLGRADRRGPRQALFVTDDGKLFNGPANLSGHTKLADYVTAEKVRNVKQYTDHMVQLVLEATGGRLRFAD